MTTPQTTSLELSKKLKALGVPQRNSFFLWLKHKTDDGWTLDWMEFGTHWDYDWLDEQNIEWCAALTSDEIGRWLPEKIAVPDVHYSGDNIANTFYLEMEREGDGWLYYYTNGDESLAYQYPPNYTNDTEARATMLIYLIENGYVDIKSLKNV